MCDFCFFFLSFRCVVVSWWFLTPGKVTQACMCAWAPIWWARETVIQPNLLCLVSSISWLVFLLVSQKGENKHYVMSLCDCGSREASVHPQTCESDCFGWGDCWLLVRGSWRPGSDSPLEQRRGRTTTGEARLCLQKFVMRFSVIVQLEKEKAQ